MTLARTLATLLLGAGLLGPGLGLAGERQGDPARGRAAFEEKRCSRCHLPRGQPALGPALEELRKPQGSFQLASRLWNHVPAMFAVLEVEGLKWPEISALEMADLMAYLWADPARDPAPDLFKGHVTLIRKGCLKCHSLKGEGGPVGPDLAELRSDYEWPAGWAATMWTHTPRMAEVAVARAVFYPRFSGDEMGNLVGFLRSIAVASTK
ncbi:MAG: hypothetical protein ACE5JD_15275 [Candidatus Methylomirabilia bacterium]